MNVRDVGEATAVCERAPRKAPCVEHGINPQPVALANAPAQERVLHPASMAGQLAVHSTGAQHLGVRVRPRWPGGGPQVAPRPFQVLVGLRSIGV